MSGAGTGLLVVISGPSGVGKTTVVNGLLELPEFERVITATTRPPRAGERDGVDYRFLDEAAFREGIDRGEFLEWADVYGKLYGTPRDAVHAVLATGGTCLLNIDVQGAASLREAGVDALFVFLSPPSFEVLADRLMGRASDSPDVVSRRLRQARAEMDRAPEYDSVVINEDLGDAIAQIRRLALTRRGESPTG